MNFIATRTKITQTTGIGMQYIFPRTYITQQQALIYCISSVIRPSFFFFQNNPKDLDPSCKTDLDLWDCLGSVKLVL